MKEVTLRAPRGRDRLEFVNLVKASRRLHRPWVYPPADARSFDEYLARTRGERFVSLLACRRTDGAITGVFNLSEIVYGNFCSAYLGYWVGAQFAGQGYMAAALPLVLTHGFRTLRLHRIEANVQPSNERSILILRAAGFRMEGFSPRYLKVGGRWRDHQRWAMTREEWAR